MPIDTATANSNTPNFIMPNGKRLTQCTYDEVWSFKMSELTKVAGLMFWVALFEGEDEDDDEADFIDDGETSTDDVEFVTEEELAERDAEVAKPH